MPLDLVIFVLTCFGLAYVVGHSQITLGLRTKLADSSDAGNFLTELLECPACFGFWTGIVHGHIVQWPWPSGSYHLVLKNVIGEALLLAATNFLLARFSNLVPPGYDDSVPPQPLTTEEITK